MQLVLFSDTFFSCLIQEIRDAMGRTVKSLIVVTVFTDLRNVYYRYRL